MSDLTQGDWTHHQIDDVNGLSMHVVEQGDGDPVIFCHGWPELWFSWRHQISATAKAGFRAIAPDQRGYGQTTAPEAIDVYSQQYICADLLALLDKLGLEQAIFVGHDWGGAVVWNMALHYPQRVRAVAWSTPSCPRAATMRFAIPVAALPAPRNTIFCSRNACPVILPAESRPASVPAAVP